jgi:hypothetical protein
LGIAGGTDFYEGNSKLYSRTFKGLSSIYHPLRKEELLLGLLNQQYQNLPFCQYQKYDCENYLFKDYRSKSGIRSLILALVSSGSYRLPVLREKQEKFIIPLTSVDGFSFFIEMGSR